MLQKAENGHSNFYFLYFRTALCILEFQLMTQLLGMEAESRHFNIQQKSKPSGNILLMVQSKRRLMVLILCVLLSNKKSIIKIRNGTSMRNILQSTMRWVFILVLSLHYRQFARTTVTHSIRAEMQNIKNRHVRHPHNWHTNANC